MGVKFTNPSRFLVAAALVSGLTATFAVRPAQAATSGNQNVAVQVTASALATLTVSYSSGSSISCSVGNSVTGLVPCSASATVAGVFRSTKGNSGGASVAITGSQITGSGGATIAPSALQMTCTGTATGTAWPGTAGSLASATALSTSPTNCQSWTGPIVAAFSLTVSLSIDSSQVLADTYPLTYFTAVATVN